MGTISRTYSLTSANPVATGSTILAAHINTDIDTAYAAINGNLDNTNIASGAAIAISKTTLGTFTDWTAHVPTFAGFSVDPTYYVSRYTQIGKVIIYHYVANADGTSNATTFTMTLPGTPVLTGGRTDFSGFYVNNDVGGSGGTYPGFAKIAATNVLQFFRVTGTYPLVVTNGAFTASNGKGIAGTLTIIYEVS